MPITELIATNTKLLFDIHIILLSEKKNLLPKGFCSIFGQNVIPHIHIEWSDSADDKATKLYGFSNLQALKRL